MHSKNILGYRGREIVWRGFRVLKPYTVRNFEVTTVLKVWEAHCQNINGFISDPPSNLRTLLLQNLWSCDIQRGRRLDGWPNTAAGKAGWRRVTHGMCVVKDGPYRLPFLYRILVALTGAAQLRAEGISSCCYIVNVPNHPSWATVCHAWKAWPGTLDPRLLSGDIPPPFPPLYVSS